MALVSIFESDKENGKTYYFRTASNVAPTLRTSLTAYPTTEGTPISDHAYRQPAQVSMTISSSLYGSANNIFYYNSKGQEVALTSPQVKSLIKEWKDNSYRLTINTREGDKFEKFNNMVITNLSWAEDGTSLGVWQPTISFEEIRIASVLVKQIKFPATKAVKANNNSKSDAGNDQGTAVATDFFGTIGGYAVKGAFIGRRTGHPIIGACLGAAIGFGRWLGRKIAGR